MGIAISTTPIGLGIAFAGTEIKYGLNEASFNLSNGILQSAEVIADRGLRAASIAAKEFSLSFLEGANELSKTHRDGFLLLSDSIRAFERDFADNLDLISARRVSEFSIVLNDINKSWMNQFNNAIKFYYLSQIASHLIDFIIGSWLCVFLAALFQAISWRHLIISLLSFIGIMAFLFVIHRVVIYLYSKTLDYYLNKTKFHIQEKLYQLDYIYYSKALPTGTIQYIICEDSANKPPPGFLFCDGSILQLNESTTNLHNLLGAYKCLRTYEGRYVNVHLPNLKGRFIADISNENCCDTGGSNEIPISIDNLPNHAHTINEGGTHSHNVRLEFGAHPTTDYPPGGPYSQITSRSEYHFQGAGHLVEVAGNHTHRCSHTGNGNPLIFRPPYFVARAIIKL